MNLSSKSTKFQTAMILGALLAGAVATRFVPERIPLAAYVQHTNVIPTTAVFKQANTNDRDASGDLTGIDVDFRRLAMLARIS